MIPDAVDNRPDREVIAASLDDPGSFRVIFDRHYDSLFGYLVIRVGHAIGADVASQTFLVAFESRSRFDARFSSARPWLYGIANNLVRNWIRTSGAAKRQVRGIDGPAESLDVEQIAWRLDAQAFVARSGLVGAINALRPDEREVLLLYAFADLSYSEIAEACSIPVGTVRSRLSRVRAKLQGALIAVEDWEPNDA